MSIGSQSLCDRIADLLVKWSFCFALLGFEFAKYPWQCITWKNCNSRWFVKSKENAHREAEHLFF